MRSPRHRAVRTVRALRRQKMPADEIRAVLTAEDPAIVGRYLELHAERLDEWVADQRQVLVSLERSLTEALMERGLPRPLSHKRPSMDAGRSS